MVSCSGKIQGLSRVRFKFRVKARDSVTFRIRERVQGDFLLGLGVGSVLGQGQVQSKCCTEKL